MPEHFFVMVNGTEAEASGVLLEFPALRTQTRTEYVPAAPGFHVQVELVVHVVTAVHELPLFTQNSY